MSEQRKSHCQNNKNSILEQRRIKYYDIICFDKIECQCCKSYYNRKYMLKHQLQKMLEFAITVTITCSDTQPNKTIF